MILPPLGCEQIVPSVLEIVSNPVGLGVLGSRRQLTGRGAMSNPRPFPRSRPVASLRTPANPGPLSWPRSGSGPRWQLRGFQTLTSTFRTACSFKEPPPRPLLQVPQRLRLHRSWQDLYGLHRSVASASSGTDSPVPEWDGQAELQVDA